MCIRCVRARGQQFTRRSVTDKEHHRAQRNNQHVFDKQKERAKQFCISVQLIFAKITTVSMLLLPLFCPFCPPLLPLCATRSEERGNVIDKQAFLTMDKTASIDQQKNYRARRSTDILSSFAKIMDSLATFHQI